jgi:hypothetical protein
VSSPFPLSFREAVFTPHLFNFTSSPRLLTLTLPFHLFTSPLHFISSPRLFISSLHLASSFHLFTSALLLHHFTFAPAPSLTYKAPDTPEFTLTQHSTPTIRPVEPSFLSSPHQSLRSSKHPLLQPIHTQTPLSITLKSLLQSPKLLPPTQLNSTRWHSSITSSSPSSPSPSAPPPPGKSTSSRTATAWPQRPTDTASSPNLAPPACRTAATAGSWPSRQAAPSIRGRATTAAARASRSKEGLSTSASRTRRSPRSRSSVRGNERDSLWRNREGFLVE